LCMSVLLFFSLRALVRRVLAPFGGRMLDALARVEPELAGVQTSEELARVVLRALRRASDSTTSQPVLYGLDPVFEARLDAAGAVHLRPRAPHEQLLVQLREAPGEILVRATLEARIVRSPRQRPLLEALQDYDVLCVVPLMAEGELEGVFFVPRGGRRAPLTLEELSALRHLARWLSGLFSVFAARVRAEARAQAAVLELRSASQQLERALSEVNSARDALALLHAGRARRRETPALIAYSPAMRALLAHLRSLATLDAPVMLCAEAGLPIEPLARFLQAESARPEPFIVLDCSALRADQAEVALFGSAEPPHEDPGALRAADRAPCSWR
jgi:transcriptional regulator with GAF, ATPase, and Fis domain